MCTPVTFTPPAEPEAREKFLREQAAAMASGHPIIDNGSGVFDQLTCACGWKSRAYWDGFDLAYGAWLEHLKANGVAL